jgi:hypothetical protein
MGIRGRRLDPKGAFGRITAMLDGHNGLPALANLNRNSCECIFKPKGNIGSESGSEILKCISHEITSVFGRSMFLHQADTTLTIRL